ncbi:MAG TPA: YajD family HNH nuclease [Syntrophales bacterium]|nr:YajD family HNH nuclease [Syntrophales bacterium]
MAKTTYSSKGGKVRATRGREGAGSGKSLEEIVREMKARLPHAEEYREKSLKIHGLICARCTREFDESTRHLLTVHHKDGNHENNPPDGSNWENLCVFCHEDAHSRSLLGEYLNGGGSRENEKKGAVVAGAGRKEGFGSLGDKLREAMERKKR